MKIYLVAVIVMMILGFYAYDAIIHSPTALTLGARL